MKKTLVLFTIFCLCISCNSKESTKKKKIEAKPKALLESINRGNELYVDMCINCHLADGKGVAKIFPPLDNSDYLKKNRKESIKAIKYGMSGEITVNGEKYNSQMLPLGLSDDEVADVMNYILNSWSNKNEEMITVKEVEKAIQ
ncbi:MAG: cytochrome c [Polaribacter sp.]|nr:cytochrome c [Polaribacter sp.]